MSTFVTSDTHWGHANIIKYCNRPFSSVSEMNEALVTNWNSMVKPTDTVFHCGDFSFMKVAQAEEVVALLNGTIVLIKGNHDDRKLLTAAGIKHIYPEAYIKYDGKIIWFNHYGAIQRERDGYKSDPVKRPTPVRDWDILLHGHSHSAKEVKLQKYQGKLHLDCGADGNEYRPYHIDEIIDLANNLT